MCVRLRVPQLFMLLIGLCAVSRVKQADDPADFLHSLNQIGDCSTVDDC